MKLDNYRAVRLWYFSIKILKWRVNCTASLRCLLYCQLTYQKGRTKLLNESTSPIEVHSNFSNLGSLENTGLALIAEIEGTDDCVLVESMSALAFSPMFRQAVAECGRNGGQIPTVGADEKCFDKSFEFLQLCARLFRAGFMAGTSRMDGGAVSDHAAHRSDEKAGFTPLRLLESCLAFEFACSTVSSDCRVERIGGEVWFNLDSVGRRNRDGVEAAVLYLDLLGRLDRHKDRKNLVRIPGERSVA